MAEQTMAERAEKIAQTARELSQGEITANTMARLECCKIEIMAMKVELLEDIKDNIANMT